MGRELPPVIEIRTRGGDVRRQILPQQRGIEPRDPVAYPLPPNASMARLDAVCQELRKLGHEVRHEWRREQLVDWDRTRKYAQTDPVSGGTALHFVAGGLDCRVIVDGRETRLRPEHLRLSRDHLFFQLLGRP